MSFELTISNQENKPRGVSEIVLEIQGEDGEKREFYPVSYDGKTKSINNLYLQPHELKTVPLCFIYDVKPILGSEKLYVVDDRGDWSRIPINMDIASTMAKKSKSRSGDYDPL